MTKAEKIKELETKVAKHKEEYYAAEWELEKLKGEGPSIDQLFEEIDASGKSMEEVIEFLKS